MAEKTKTDDKRKLERFNIKIPAKIEVTSSEKENEIFELLTSDICSGGAFFHTPQPLPEGTHVKMDLILPIEKLKQLQDDCKQVYIKISGTVLRAESAGMAICFDEDYQIGPCRPTPVTRH